MLRFRDRVDHDAASDPERALTVAAQTQAAGVQMLLDARDVSPRSLGWSPQPASYETKPAT